MKIDGNHHFINTDFRIKQEERPEARPQVTRSPKDRLEFSSTVRKVQRQIGDIDDVDSSRAERVAEIKEQVETGTYTIKAEKIAEAMIAGNLINVKI